MKQQFACNECDFLIYVENLEEGQVASCPRCKNHVVNRKINPINRTLAVSLAGLIIFFPALFQPLMSMHVLSLENSASLFTGMVAIWDTELYLVASMIFFFCIFTPFIKLTTALIICLGVKFDKVHNEWFKQLFLIYYKADTWEMVEVFMIGILVSIFKLKDLADLTLNFGIISFAILVLSVNALKLTLDTGIIWEKIDNAK